MSQLTARALSAVHILLLDYGIPILFLRFFVLELLATPAAASPLANRNGHGLGHLKVDCYDGWFMGLVKI